MTYPSNKAVLMQAFHHFNDLRSRKNFFELYADHAVMHPSPPLAPGVEAIKEWYRLLWSAFADCHLELGNVAAKGSFVVNKFRLSLSGTIFIRVMRFMANATHQKVHHCLDRWRTAQIGISNQPKARLRRLESNVKPDQLSISIANHRGQDRNADTVACSHLLPNHIVCFEYDGSAVQKLPQPVLMSHVVQRRVISNELPLSRRASRICRVGI